MAGDEENCGATTFLPYRAEQVKRLLYEVL